MFLEMIATYKQIVEIATLIQVMRDSNPAPNNDSKGVVLSPNRRADVQGHLRNTDELSLRDVVSPKLHCVIQRKTAGRK